MLDAKTNSSVMICEEDCAPEGVPCAQCGSNIPRPEWSEPGAGRISFVWRCAGCNYLFSSVVFYRCDEAKQAA